MTDLSSKLESIKIPKNNSKRRKNNMKTTIKNEVFDALCDYLIARKAYSNKKECLNDLHHDSEMVIGTLIYLDAMGEPNAIDMYFSYMKVLEA